MDIKLTIGTRSFFFLECIKVVMNSFYGHNFYNIWNIFLHHFYIPLEKEFNFLLCYRCGKMLMVFWHVILIYIRLQNPSHTWHLMRLLNLHILVHRYYDSIAFWAGWICNSPLYWFWLHGWFITLSSAKGTDINHQEMLILLFFCLFPLSYPRISWMDGNIGSPAHHLNIGKIKDGFVLYRVKFENDYPLWIIKIPIF